MRLASAVALWFIFGDSIRLVGARFEEVTVTATANVEARRDSTAAEASLDQETAQQQQNQEGECRAADGTCGASVVDEPSSIHYGDDNNDDDGECADTHDCTAIQESIDGLETTCLYHWETMQKECRATCKICNEINSAEADNVYSEMPQQITGPQIEEIWEYQLKVDKYMYNEVYVDVEKYSKVKFDCKNRNALCTFWAFIGECENNPSYMTMNCAPACFTCEQLSFEARCPFDKDAPVAWPESGNLNNMFERIVSDPEFQQYNPQILSQPEPQNDSIDQGPWVVVLDDFLTPEECQTLIDLGGARGYERSRDVGARKFDGTFDGKESTGRTSSNAWCTEECWENETTQTVHQRMEKLLDIPMGNYEYLQLLKYEEGQFYEEHHDYIGHHLDRFPGPRILTLFLYLNTVEEGGGTNFPFLDDLTVQPKLGRALLWPSVKDEDPMRKDERTQHEALPPIKGVKYGANAWIHQRDFKEAWKKGCH